MRIKRVNENTQTSNMKVFKATYHGFDAIHFLIAALDIDDVSDIVKNTAGYDVDYYSISEIDTLSTNLTDAQIIDEF